MSKTPPQQPTLQHIKDIQDDFRNWCERVNIPSAFKDGFYKRLQILFRIYKEETNSTWAVLLDVSPSANLPMKTTKAFQVLWRYYHREWSTDEESDDEMYYAPD